MAASAGKGSTTPDLKRDATTPPNTRQPMVNETDAEQGSVGETVAGAVKGTDRPIGEKNPKAPLALVWYTYPVVLLLVLIAALLWMTFN